jgi:small conductance mechanosensitive channel
MGRESPIGARRVGTVALVVTPFTTAPPADGTDQGLLDACGEDPTWMCREVYEWTGSEVLADIADWLIGRPLTIAVILLVGWVATLIARRYVRRGVERFVAADRSGTKRRLEALGFDALDADAPDPRRSARAASISAVVASTTAVVIWAVTIMIALGEAGIDLAPLIAGAGIAGVALGFGAQTLVKDCIAGLCMLIEDQYGIGDHVDLGEATGTVERISLRVTVLRDPNGTVWHVPNGEVQRVGNRSQLWSVAVVDVDVAYDADLERVREVLLDVATDVCSEPEWAHQVLEDPEVLGVEMLGADGITVRMHVKTTPGVQWRLQRELRERIKKRLDREGIEIPFPQRTIWVRNEA